MLLNIIFLAPTARIINNKNQNDIIIRKPGVAFGVRLHVPYVCWHNPRTGESNAQITVPSRFARWQRKSFYAKRLKFVSYGHSASRCCKFRSHLIAALCQGLQISRCCRCALCKPKVKVSFEKTKQTGRIEIHRKSCGCQRWPLINTLRQIRLANCVYTLNNPKSLRELITGEKVSLKTLLVN